jgi:hypothetical protein
MNEVKAVLWIGPVIGACIIDLEANVWSNPVWLYWGQVESDDLSGGKLVGEISAAA